MTDRQELIDKILDSELIELAETIDRETRRVSFGDNLSQVLLEDVARKLREAASALSAMKVADVTDDIAEPAFIRWYKSANGGRHPSTFPGTDQVYRGFKAGMQHMLAASPEPPK